MRMWEIQDLPLAAEPASPGSAHTHTHTLSILFMTSNPRNSPQLGFFGMLTLGRSNKQTGSSSRKPADVPNLKMLELMGDLIGHSGAVQVRITLYF